MDEISNTKIIQAMFSFLEAVHGKKDKKAISELVHGMIDAMMEDEQGKVQTADLQHQMQWTCLDHALRSPMNGILGFTNILMEECNDPEVRWKLEQINSSAQKLMQIFINNRIYGYAIQPSEDKSKQCQKAEKTPGLSAKPAKTSPQKSRSPRKKLPNILIVEDNTVNSNLLMHHLKKRCHLFFSVSGNAAIEITRSEKIDAIFMDINLGEGMDGIQAMNVIRKQTGNESLPVIAVTGFAGEEHREKFLQAGFNDFIAKPFQRQDVIDVFAKIFKEV